MRLAPGITISQAVIKIEGALVPTHIQLLEERLKTHRNRPPFQHALGLMISERSRRTRKPGKEWSEKTAIDSTQKAKRDQTSESKISLLKKLVPDSKGFHNLFSVEMEDVAGGKDKSTRQ